MKIISLGPSLAILLILTCSASLLANDSNGGFDTTRVRPTTQVKKSAGEKLADLPGEILKLPVRAVEFISYAVGTNPPVKTIINLIDFAGPARPYIPIIGFSSRTGLKLGFGLRQTNRSFWTNRLYFKWYYSTHNYQSYKFRFRVHKLFGERIGVDLYYRYKKRTRERFYGLGNNSQKAHEVNYTHEHSEFRADLPLHLSKALSIGVTGGFLITNLTDGRDPDFPGTLDSIYSNPNFAMAPGHLDGGRYLRFGGMLEYDGRNHGGQPSKGLHFLTRVDRYIGTGRSGKQGYVETTYDFRHYLSVWRKRILATRIHFHRLDADDRNTRLIPINLISQLGGEAGLRGYSTSRFVDNDLLVLSAEWRFPVWHKLDGFVFLDEGRIYRAITKSKVFNDWKYSAGGGLRIWNAQQVSFLTTIAQSDEGTRFYIATSATW